MGYPFSLVVCRKASNKRHKWQPRISRSIWRVFLPEQQCYRHIVHLHGGVPVHTGTAWFSSLVEYLFILMSSPALCSLSSRTYLLYVVHCLFQPPAWVPVHTDVFSSHVHPSQSLLSHQGSVPAVPGDTEWTALPQFTTRNYQWYHPIPHTNSSMYTCTVKIVTFSLIP